MKRVFKFLGIVLGLFIVLIGGFAAYISIKGIPTFDVQIPANVASLQVPRDSALIDRGAKIATLLCKECHRGPDGKMIGQVLPEMPEEFGALASYNITQDPVHGIGSWTDGELYYFLRTGLRKDGTWAPPYMPKFPLMADADIYSVIAWLRSADPSLAPDPRENPINRPNFLVKLLSNVVFKPMPLPEKTISIPDSSNQIAFGRYAADALCACYGCHSADFKTMNELEPEKSGGFYGGGNPMLNKSRQLVPSANITMDKETGIGNWTQAQFYEAVKFGKSPKGGPLHYPMFPHTTLSDTEVHAIWAYLQTVPQLKNAVTRYTGD